MDINKRRAFHFLLSAQLAAAGILMTGAAQATDVGAQFIHVVTVENSAGRSTKLDHPLSNNDQSAIIHVTQNWNPPGAPGTYNNSAVGVTYDTSEDKWNILNKETAAIPLGASFNIWIPPVDAATFVHTSTVGSITHNHTVIDHPLTNNNPNAMLRVTQNFFAAGGSAFNDHRIGVWYNGSAWSIFNQDLAAMPDHASFNVTVLPDHSTVLLHKATPANTIGGSTFIDHPLTNNNPNAIVSITQNWNPGGVGGVYNNHTVAVWYYDVFERWAVFNQDHTAVPDGASFNVSAPSLERALFVHTADPGNIIGHWTIIDNPLSNNNPHATLSVTQNRNPGGGGGVFNNHAFGVRYSSTHSKWAIFNQDTVAMPEGASFNVSVPAANAATFVHTTGTGNISGPVTYLDNPVINSDPNAIVHVTQNWNPSGVGGVFNDYPVAVIYSDYYGKWSVFNQDTAAMPEGPSFNISIPAADAATFVHTATAGNISGTSTVFHHPVSDGNPDAIILVTQSWNPGGGGGVYNDHQIGVAYTGAEWSIFNQDGATMPVGASFNVTVEDPPFFSDGFESGDTSAWSGVVP